MSTDLTADLSGTYTIDPAHSRIGFVARHAMITKVRGSFDEFDGGGVLDADNPENSSLRLTIKTASIDTRNADRDNHLRSNDFFDMENYPEITFESTSVKAVDTTHFDLTGDLKIKDTTKPVTVRARVHGQCCRPVRQPPDRARGLDRDEPQGLGRQLQRRPRRRRPARQ